MMHRFMAALWALTASLAIFVSMSAVQSASLTAQVYNDGGLDAGIDAGSKVSGPVSVGSIDVAIIGAVDKILTYVALVAVIAIIVAGLYILLSGGSQREKAKEIIIWTIVGLIVILLAKVIVSTVYNFLGAQEAGNVNVGQNVLIQTAGINGLGIAVVTVVNAILDYVALIAVIAIIIAGLYLIVTGGSQKERAKEIIIYTIVGLVIILLAKVIVLTVYHFLGVGDPALIAGTNVHVLNAIDARSAIITVVNNVLSFVALIAIIAIIVAGLYLILGFGSESSKERAKNIVIYTVVGLVVILLAKLIVALPTILLK